MLVNLNKYDRPKNINCPKCGNEITLISDFLLGIILFPIFFVIGLLVLIMSDAPWVSIVPFSFFVWLLISFVKEVKKPTTIFRVNCTSCKASIKHEYKSELNDSLKWVVSLIQPNEKIKIHNPLTKKKLINEKETLIVLNDKKLERSPLRKLVKLTLESTIFIIICAFLSIIISATFTFIIFTGDFIQYSESGKSIFHVVAGVIGLILSPLRQIFGIDPVGATITQFYIIMAVIFPIFFMVLFWGIKSKDK